MSAYENVGVSSIRLINFYKLNLTLRIFRFCSAMKAILEHGMKKSMIMGGSSHPWLFIEEATRKEIEKDFRSVYARLVLCKTFRYFESRKLLG